MKKLLKKMGEMREGATLVTVVIATAFMLAIGAVILAATTRYLVSVYMDRNSNENLYDAEGILEEVRCGLLEYAGESGEEAYKNIVTSYETNKGELRTIFAKQYIIGIVEKITGKTFAVDDTNDPKKTGDPIDKPASLVAVSKDSLANLTKHPEAIKSKKELDESLGKTTPTAAPGSPEEESDIIKFVFNYSDSKGYYLTIKNLVIDYTNDAGYRSTIETDIQINVPDYKFEGASLLDAAKDFLTISDSKLELGIGSGAAPDVDEDPTILKRRLTDAYDDKYNIKMNGNIYAGDTDLENTGYFMDCKPSIQVDNSVAARFNCEKLITREDFAVGRGSKVRLTGPENTSAGDVYVKNFKVVRGQAYDPDSETAGFDGPEPGKGTFLDLNANMYVDNDLDIRDSGSTVSLGGNYFGYSYNEKNDDSPIKKADFSSAILINGYNTTLDTMASGFGNLVLAGRAFVSRNGSVHKDTADIILGESMSVKSNQLAYLVPDKYIIFGHNPITHAEANIKKVDFYDVDALINKSDMLAVNSELKNYLNADKPVIANYVDKGGNSDLVYLYLNFKDDYHANLYFKNFYDDESEKDGFDKNVLNERAFSYITDREYPGIYLHPSLYMVAGNIIHNYREVVNDTTGERRIVADRLDDSYFVDNSGENKPSPALLEAGRTYGITYSNMQNTLTANGNATEMRAPITSKLVSDNLIDFSAISGKTITKDKDKRDKRTQGIVLVNAGNEITGTTFPTGVGKEEELPIGLIISDGDLTVKTPCAGVIIAKGNVTFEATGTVGKPTFSGLIISGGKVLINSKSSLKSNKLLVDKLFEYMQSDDELYSLIIGATAPETQNATEMTKCIKYLNWTKNAY